MLDLATHEVRKRFDYPDSKGEWYDIRYMSPQEYDECENDLEAFQKVVGNWGGITVSGKTHLCNKKNKVSFYESADDRVQEILFTSMLRSFFAPSGEEFIIKMGKYLAMSKNGAKPNQNLTTQIAEPA